MAHNLAMDTALRIEVDMLVIVEPNIRMAEKNEWIKESSCDAAVLRVKY